MWIKCIKVHKYLFSVGFPAENEVLNGLWKELIGSNSSIAKQRRFEDEIQKKKIITLLLVKGLALMVVYIKVSRYMSSSFNIKHIFDTPN